MKFLVFGHKGWIGSMVTKLLEKQNIHFVCAKSRAENKKAVEEEILLVKPTHVMSFIGRTHGTTDDGTKYTTIDYLEQKGKIKENENKYEPNCVAVAGPRDKDNVVAGPMPSAPLAPQLIIF